MGWPAGAGPGMVTAAAVLAFIWGGLGILFGLIGLAAGSVLTSASSAVCNDSSLTPPNRRPAARSAASGTF